MSGLAMAAIWAVAVVSADANDYAAAHKAAVETGKPMVVMVSTDWCAVPDDEEDDPSSGQETRVVQESGLHQHQS